MPVFFVELKSPEPPKKRFKRICREVIRPEKNLQVIDINILVSFIVNVLFTIMDC